MTSLYAMIKPRQVKSSSARYVDEFLNNDNTRFDHKQMINQIYPAALQLNKAYSFDSDPPGFGLIQNKTA